MAYKDIEKHKEYCKAYYQAHKEEHKDRVKSWQQSHREEYKAYKRTNTNYLGKSKDCIRTKSRYYLFNVLKHTNIEGYEIHHCFGYEDYKKFIYIPKELHLQIHQYLRDNGISADTDHYSKIAHLVVAWEGYVFIKD